MNLNPNCKLDSRYDWIHDKGCLWYREPKKEVTNKLRLDEFLAQSVTYYSTLAAYQTSYPLPSTTTRYFYLMFVNKPQQLALIGISKTSGLIESIKPHSGCSWDMVKWLQAQAERHSIEFIR